MRAAVGGEGREPVAESLGGAVDGQLGELWRFAAAAVGVGAAQRVAHMTTLAGSTLALMVLWLAEPTTRREAHALDEGAEHLARQLGAPVRVRHERVGKPAANDRRRILRRCRRAQADGAHLA